MTQYDENGNMKLLNDCQKNGDWLLVTNCDVVNELLSRIENWDRSHGEFRLIILCDPRYNYPMNIFHSSIKVAYEGKSGIKSTLLDVYSRIVTQEYLDKYDDVNHKTLVFAISFLYSILKERSKLRGIQFS